MDRASRPPRASSTTNARRRAWASLVGSSFFKSLLDEVRDGVYFVDRERKITYWNDGAERITGFKRKDVEGRSCAHGLLRHVDKSGNDLCDRRCPLVQAMKEGKAQEADAYLHHQDGRRIPVRIRVSPMRDSKGQITGAVELFSDDSMQEAYRLRIAELQKASLIDPLTHLANRRYASFQIDLKLNELRRYGLPFGLLFFDIDNFKQFNDRLGHDTGDRVLLRVARAAARCVRATDLVSRWGGDEFVAVIGQVDGDGLAQVAEKIRTTVARSRRVAEGAGQPVTLSLGATMAGTGDQRDSLVARADGLMYRSKARGGNRITL